mmetsp:Transcript_16414/g.30496  ORF Transcript_16414/g.30496 Transcript_16414/m.30496 type:complete len:244 (-) Transcript_16414:445-1176(-)
MFPDQTSFNFRSILCQEEIKCWGCLDNSSAYTRKQPRKGILLFGVRCHACLSGGGFFVLLFLFLLFVLLFFFFFLFCLVGKLFGLAALTWSIIGNPSRTTSGAARLFLLFFPGRLERLFDLTAATRRSHRSARLFQTAAIIMFAFVVDWIITFVTIIIVVVVVVVVFIVLFSILLVVFHGLGIVIIIIMIIIDFHGHNRTTATRFIIIIIIITLVLNFNLVFVIPPFFLGNGKCIVSSSRCTA